MDRFNLIILVVIIVVVGIVVKISSTKHNYAIEQDIMRHAVYMEMQCSDGTFDQFWADDRLLSDELRSEAESDMTTLLAISPDHRKVAVGLWTDDDGGGDSFTMERAIVIVNDRDHVYLVDPDNTFGYPDAKPVVKFSPDGTTLQIDWKILSLGSMSETKINKMVEPKSFREAMNKNLLASDPSVEIPPDGKYGTFAVEKITWTTQEHSVRGYWLGLSSRETIQLPFP